jgi:beta-galactosidase/beta-glucuronidase
MDGDEFTGAGEAIRAEIEWTTDRQERPIIEALGDDAEELFSLLEPMTAAVVQAKGYPGHPRDRTRYDQ